jgi:hypothetical protein
MVAASRCGPVAQRKISGNGGCEIAAAVLVSMQLTRTRSTQSNVPAGCSRPGARWVPVASQRLDDWCEAPLQDPFVEHTARFDALFETLPRCPAGASCALRF